ncbi:stealth family protein [Legionella dresdenensis]|uniref:stealth family protein n=1 Tax=Legionella dresdenensis TaxID=450200 RepID=UPI0036D42169
MITHPQQTEPVDAVITWVDGHDPCHQQKLADYFAEHGINVRPKAAEPTRFNQCGEIYYCVLSLLQYAPWIRTIYIVTDNQIPAIINQLAGTAYEHKVKVVDHKQIFSGYESCLPTFNSLAIESVLWRIEGLAERFIYLNDDCILIRPVSYQDFFNGEKLVLRGSWKTQARYKWHNRLKQAIYSLLRKPLDILKNNEYRGFQELSAEHAGFKRRFFHLPHMPFPLHKQPFVQFHQDFPVLFEQNLRFRLRNRKQFWLISLIYHLEIKNNKAVIDNTIEEITFHTAFHSFKKIRQRLSRAEIGKKHAFICIQSLDQATQPVLDYLSGWLNQRIKPL